MVTCLQGMPLVHLMKICRLFPYNVLLTLLPFPNLGSSDFGVPCNIGKDLGKSLINTIVVS